MRGILMSRMARSGGVALSAVSADAPSVKVRDVIALLLQQHGNRSQDVLVVVYKRDVCHGSGRLKPWAV